MTVLGYNKIQTSYSVRGKFNMQKQTYNKKVKNNI